MSYLASLRIRTPFAHLSVLAALCLLLLLPANTSAQEVSRQLDVVFCNHDGTDLRADIAFPSELQGTYPALIFISGSGWGNWWGYGMDRHQFNSAIVTAAEHGYVAATVDYRPTSIKENGKAKYPHPAQLADVRSAIRWLRANAAKYHVDANHIGAIGWSSGGHLSLMLGLAGPEPDQKETDNASFSSQVQAVVSLAGPTELSRMYHEASYPGISDALSDLMGGTPEQVPANYRKASPLYYVTRNAPPILIIQGDNDTEVPYDQATLFVEAMKNLGAPVSMVVLKGFGHLNAYYHEAIFPFFDKALKTR